MGKSNAAIYQSLRVLEVLHGWKLDLDNVVWDVPTFIQRRQTIHTWDHVIPDEMQRNAGNRTWQTQDNAIVGEELETGSFEHKHVIMTVPSKHRLDKLIADVCTSQMVINRTDSHNQISYTTIYALARGQLDRNANERTPKLGDLTLGKVIDEVWREYLKRKRAYFEKRRKINLEKALSILNEGANPRASMRLNPDQIESLILENPARCIGKDGSFSFSRVQVYLHDKGYDIPYQKARQGTKQANEHRRLREEQEQVEEDA